MPVAQVHQASKSSLLTRLCLGERSCGGKLGDFKKNPSLSQEETYLGNFVLAVFALMSCRS